MEDCAPANTEGEVSDSFQGTAPHPPHPLPTHSERRRERERERERERGEKKGERGEEREKGIESTVRRSPRKRGFLGGSVVKNLPAILGTRLDP